LSYFEKNIQDKFNAKELKVKNISVYFYILNCYSDEGIIMFNPCTKNSSFRDIEKIFAIFKRNQYVYDQPCVPKFHEKICQ